MTFAELSKAPIVVLMLKLRHEADDTPNISRLAFAGTIPHADRCHGMSEFRFDPPVMLQSNVAVNTFGEAAAFVRSFHGARRPLMQQSILRRLESARTLEERRDAADAFRGWARTEGLILKP